MKHFIIQELVDKQTFIKRGEKSIELIDYRVIETLDYLRDKFGPITVNNWHMGGDREWSGLRTKESPYYSKYSQHTFGRAADCIFKDVSSEEVRQYIIKYSGEFRHIHGLELDTSWLHFDTRNFAGIKTFNP